jgi:hypothetical protein
MGHQDLAPYTPRDYGPGRNDVVKGPHRDGQLPGGLLAVIQEALICGGPNELDCARHGRLNCASHFDLPILEKGERKTKYIRVCG